MPKDALSNAEYHRNRRTAKKAEWDRLKAVDAAAKRTSDGAELLKSTKAIEKNTADMAGLFFVAMEHITNDVRAIALRVEALYAQFSKLPQGTTTDTDAGA